MAGAIFPGDLAIKHFYGTLIPEEQLSVTKMKECALSTGKLMTRLLPDSYI